MAIQTINLYANRINKYIYFIGQIHSSSQRPQLSAVTGTKVSYLRENTKSIGKARCNQLIFNFIPLFPFYGLCEIIVLKGDVLPNLKGASYISLESALNGLSLPGLKFLFY